MAASTTVESMSMMWLLKYMEFCSLYTSCAVVLIRSRPIHFLRSRGWSEQRLSR